MNQTDKIAAVLALHDETHTADAMVYEVWNDGEVTLTKGGDLYGMRNLHMIYAGDEAKALPIESLPLKYNNSRIVVADNATALRARDIILGYGE